MRVAIFCMLLLLPPARGWGDEPNADPAFTSEQLEFFEREVRPLLVSHCFECHSAQADKLQGGLHLDSREAILTGGDTGPAVVPGSAVESMLIDAINYGDLYQMPPKSKLSDEQIAVLTRWVEMGLPWPPNQQATGADTYEFDLAERKAAHWAWQPLKATSPPVVAHNDWPQDDIDRFILAQLEAQNLRPLAEADRRTWIRRVYFDLIGLPPTVEEVQQFVADRETNAYEKVVDPLLNSPHFGERWARHWLDLVRYAESRGHEFDYDVPNAFQYRDYVIRALNDDLPYDQFVMEHIAGDLLEQPRRHPIEGFNESILGTGFWFLGEWVHSPVDIRKDECDRFDNMIDVFSKTFLGLTVACARCHEHKFDAISQTDYYALAGFLQSSSYRQAAFDTMEHNAQVAKQLEPLRRHYHQRMGEALLHSDQAEMLDQLDSILLASCDALKTWSATVSPEKIEAAARADELPAELLFELRSVPQSKDLRVDWLSYWTRHLLRARNHPNDPLWLWAQLAVDARENAEIAGLIDTWRSPFRAAEDPIAGGGDEVRTIINYIHPATSPWIVDGFSFGSGPIERGQLVWEDAVLRVASYGAARRDPLWTQLSLADDVDGESARLSAWNRVGKIIRTPTFELDGRLLHYLVRGSGVAYAVVDSHAMINGPLHGSLLHEFKSNEGRTLQWVSHDLRRYAGHDLHIEFSPVDDEPFELLWVIQAESPPPVIEPNAAAAFTKQLAQFPVTNPSDLAVVYRDLLQRTLTSIASAESAPDISSDDAALRDWLVQHVQHASSVETAIDSLRQEFAREQSKLAEQIQRRSHTAPAMWDGTGHDERLLIRGNPKTTGDVVPRRFLLAIAGNEQPLIEVGSGRLELARRVLSPNNPFTSRVYVNRIWYHLMGGGIVTSVDNFGVLGELPSHPELLDHLALSFMQDGWSTKRLIRRIVLSSTYRMSSSATDPQAEQLDPQNKLWHRMPLKRLEGEVIRDSLLAVSGRLDRTMYGRSVPIHLTPFMQGRGRPTISGALDGTGRRSIYIAVRRNFLSPMMLAFDTPQPFNTVGRRTVSNVPAQALILMNDPFVREQCQQWAQRTLDKVGNDTDAGITHLYETAFARPPQPEELAAAREFLLIQGAELGLTAEDALRDARVWTDLCHVLVNVKEFIFVR